MGLGPQLRLPGSKVRALSPVAGLVLPGKLGQQPPERGSTSCFLPGAATPLICLHPSCLQPHPLSRWQRPQPAPLAGAGGSWGNRRAENDVSSGLTFPSLLSPGLGDSRPQSLCHIHNRPQGHGTRPKVSAQLPPGHRTRHRAVTCQPLAGAACRPHLPGHCRAPLSLLYSTVY